MSSILLGIIAGRNKSKHSEREDDVIIIRPIMQHFYRAIFLTSQVIQRHTYTSINN